MRCSKVGKQAAATGASSVSAASSINTTLGLRLEMSALYLLNPVVVVPDEDVILKSITLRWFSFFESRQNPSEGWILFLMRL